MLAKNAVTKSSQLGLGLLALLVSSSAFAGRYWRGAYDDALFSNTNNWASDSHSGAGGNSYPGQNADEGTTYFCKIKNALCEIDGTYTLPGNILVGTQDNGYFVWRTTNPAYGFAASSRELQITANISNADRTPAFLQIDSGTYSFGTTRIGYVNNGKAGLLFNNGTFTANKLRVGGGKSGVDGTLTIKGGTFSTAATGDDVFMVCDQGNTKGTLIIEGGTLNTTNGNQVCVGGGDEIDAQIYINTGGVWNAKRLILGGKRVQTYSVTNSVAKLYVNGGTLNLSGENGLGYANGEGSYAEMIVNDGVVNYNYGYFYLAEQAPAALTINGGTFTMKSNSSGGMTFGRNTSDAGILTLNGGVLATSRLRVDKLSKSGSKVIFNGGALKALNDTADYIKVSDYIECVVDEGGLVFDTASYNVTIAHDLVLASGVSSAPLVKKGEGTLTLSGTTPFAAEDIIVYRGSVVVGGVTYGVNAVEPIDASAGGELGVFQIHGDKLAGWLNDSDLTSYSTTYGASGTASYELPEILSFGANGAIVSFTNLNIATTYNESVGGVSFSFSTTNQAPRTILAIAPDGDKVKNIRDVGSWPLQSTTGKKMNQGVIYRGGHLDHFLNSTADQRAASALACLKSEIELRNIDRPGDYEGVSSSFAATNCAYVNCGLDFDAGGWINYGTQIDADDGNGWYTNQLRKVFSALGTPGMLPSYFHCRIGTDRTGIVGLLLLGMMGVEEEVLYRDYLMSNFANIGGSRDTSVPENFLRYILRGYCNDGKYAYTSNDATYGRSVASRCRQYLEMCGVTSAELETITQALSGETPAEVLARVDAYETANNYRTVSYVKYAGSSTTNAIHRFGTNGKRILPRETPTRDGYTFQGWDVEHETVYNAATGDSVVYAKWSANSGPTVYYWADANASSEKFNRAESWDPEPESMGNVAQDTFVLNKGADKVATFASGDSVTAANVYIGYAGDFEDKGGRIDVSGGTLTATNYLFLGNTGSTSSNNYLNIYTGGKVVAGKLRSGDASTANGKCDYVNIDGGSLEVNVDAAIFAYKSSSTFEMDITNNGSYSSSKDFVLARSGTSTLNLSSGSFDLGSSQLYVGGQIWGGSGTGTMNVSGGTVNSGTVTIGLWGGTGRLSVAGGQVNCGSVELGVNGGSTAELIMTGGHLETSGSSTISIGKDVDGKFSSGRVCLSGTATITNKWAVYVGRKGNGELTIDGGILYVEHALQMGYGGGSGNTAVVNLNGGLLKTAQVNADGETACTFNWNGGTLSRNGTDHGPVFKAADNITLNVLTGGAFFYSDNNDSYITQPMSGPGAFTKRGVGGKKLSLQGHVDLRGGFIVEEGELDVLDIAEGTTVMQVSVAADCVLDLNGATVKTYSYVSGGVSHGPGTYSAHNGTIVVLATPVSTSPSFAVWTNGNGNNDLEDPANWIALDESGNVIFNAIPDGNTDVQIPVGLARPDLTGMTVKSASLLVSSDTYLRGDCTVPSVVTNAVCWYDFDDLATVRMGDGSFIATVVNKGTGGTDFNASVYGKTDETSSGVVTTFNPPVYGDNGVNGRLAMIQSPVGDEGSCRSRGMRTDNALGLQGDHDRTLIVASRCGSDPHYPISIEKGKWGDEGTGYCRIQSNGSNAKFQFDAQRWSNTEQALAQKTHEINPGQDPADWAVRMFQTEYRAASEDCLVSARVYSEAGGLTESSMVATNLNAQADSKLYLGYRYLYDSPSRGQIGEAMYFDRALTAEERVAIQNYLAAKWITKADMSNMPTNLVIENGAMIDFGGGWWTFGTITGSGTIGTANVTITGSMDPGLTVGGKVVFANGATINLAALPKSALGTTVTFLTAESIENFPRKVRGGGRISSPRLVDNGDGTVSLVGIVSSAGFKITLR